MPLNIPDSDKKRIVIIGAGFAGLTLARKLRNSPYQIILINKQNYHQFQPLYYQVAMAGLEPSAISFPLRKIFQKNDNVIIRVCEALSVDAKLKILETSLGKLEYDYLVIAHGAGTNYYQNKNIEKNAFPLKSVGESLSLRNAILNDYEKALTEIDFENRQGFIDIVIVGGGPTGVELAGSLAEMRKYILPKDYKELNKEEIDIYLIQSGDCLLKGMSQNASEKALRFLKKLGVQVVLNNRVIEFDGETVRLKDGNEIKTKKMIWAAGIKANRLNGLPEAVISDGGRIYSDSFSRVKSVNDIFALGDIALMPTELYPDGHPQLAQPAIQQAERNCSQRISNEN